MKKYNFRTTINGFITVPDDTTEEILINTIKHCLYCTFENESNSEYFYISKHGKLKVKVVDD